MTHSEDLKNLESRVVIQTYKRQPIVLTRGEGCYVWDLDGTRYLDLIAGVAVDALGHCDPSWIAAVTQQAKKLVHVSNLYYSEPMIRLAQRLAGIAEMDRTFFCNSGAEANEAAIKIARKWGKKKRGANCNKIVTFERGFHGRTLGALSATATKKYCEPFEPLVPGFEQIPLYDNHKLHATLNADICAVMIEPIQGEGGIWPIEAKWLQELQELCKEREILFICDEVQTGIGRTGKWFGFQRADLRPDLVPLAKGLGGGFPIGACLASGTAATVLEAGDHGSTYAGSPLACAAALAVLDAIEQRNLLSEISKMGALLRSGLEGLALQFDIIDHVRGEGLMLALETKKPIARQIVNDGLRYNLLLNATGDTTIRFLPPLTIERADIEFGLGKLLELFSIQMTK